jgi:hypothetical protein
VKKAKPNCPLGFDYFPETFDFDQDRVQVFLNHYLSTRKEKQQYLEWILAEYKKTNEYNLHDAQEKLQIEKMAAERLSDPKRFDKINRTKKEQCFVEYVKSELSKLEPRKTKKPARSEAVIEWRAILEKAEQNPSKRYDAKTAAALCGVKLKTIYGWADDGLTAKHVPGQNGMAVLQRVKGVRGWFVESFEIAKFANIQILEIENKNT